MVHVISSTREYSSGPRSSPSEPDGVKFKSNAEMAKYAQDNNLNIRESPWVQSRKAGRTTYRYHPVLKEILEVDVMRNLEGFAREVQEKHPDYSWEKCLRIAKKAVQKEEKTNGKKA